MSIKLVAQLHPFKTDLTIIQHEPAPLAELFNSLNIQTDIKNARIMIEDRIVTDFSEIPEDGSTVYIKIVPEGNNKNAGKGMGWAGALMIVAGAAISIASYGSLSWLGGSMIGAGVGLLAGGVALYNTQIPKIGGNSDNERVEQSPSIRGSQNLTNQWGPVPILLGRHLMYPFNAATPYTSISSDMAGTVGYMSTANNQYLTMLYCLGYNNINIDYSTLKIGDTKLVDLSYTKNINSIRNGSDPYIWLEVIQNGANSQIYPNVCKETIIGLEIKHATPLVRTTVAKTTRIVVDICFPTGVVQYNKKGNAEYRSVMLKFEYKPAGSPDSQYVPFSGSGQTEHTGKNTKTIRWSWGINVPTGQYDVRVTRVTADAADSKTIDSVTWLSLKSFRADRPVRAETAAKLTIIALKVRATDLINGVVNQLNMVGQSVLPVYSGSGSGASSWAGTAATSNPAACFKYALQGAINTDPLANDAINWESLEYWYQWCAVHNYTCNAYIADEVTLRQLLYQITSTARAEFTKVNNKVGVVQDIEKSSPVQLFTPRNTWGFEATKLFADIPNALQMQFINASAGYVDDQRIVYDTTGGYGDGTGGTTEAKKKQTVKLWGVTDPAQAYLIGKYMYAVTYLRPWIYVFNVDIEYLLANRGSRVKLAHDVALRGLAWGRLNGRIMDGSNVAGFVLDELVTMETGNSYVIRIRKKDNSMVLLPVELRAGSSREIYLQAPLLASTAPDTGDLFAFGISGQETDDVIITKVEPLDEKSAKITAVDYSPEIFGVDDPAYVIPTYDPKVTVGGIMDKGTTDFNPDPAPATLEDLNEAVKSLYEGETDYIPADLTSLSATAGEQGLTLVPGIAQGGIASGIKCHYQIKRGDADWQDIAVNNGFYAFVRSIDGYPEKNTLDTWWVRAKAVNQYGNESASWYSAAVDTTNYGTWLVQSPTVTGRASKRSLSISMQQPSSVYGNVRYKVQICSELDFASPGDISTATWYEPNVAANPYGSETAYRGTQGGYRLVVTDFALTVPLTGQNHTKTVDGQTVDDPAPQDTRYWFRITPTNLDTTIDGTPYITDGLNGRLSYLTAKATSAYDVVKAWATDPTTGEKTEVPGALHAEHIYTEDLAAISGVFGQIAGDKEGQHDNFWNLDTNKTEFRVGNNINLEKGYPLNNPRTEDDDNAEYIHYKNGSLMMKLKNFIVTVSETVIKGTLALYNDARDFRNLVSYAGMKIQKKLGDWLDVAQITADKNDNIVITNKPSALSVFQIAPPSSTIKVHHLDTNLNDTDGNNSESLLAESGGCGATAAMILDQANSKLASYFEGKLKKTGVVTKSAPAYDQQFFAARDIIDGIIIVAAEGNEITGYKLDGTNCLLYKIDITTRLATLCKTVDLGGSYEGVTVRAWKYKPKPFVGNMVYADEGWCWVVQLVRYTQSLSRYYFGYFISFEGAGDWGGQGRLAGFHDGTVRVALWNGGSGIDLPSNTVQIFIHNLDWGVGLRSSPIYTLDINIDNADIRGDYLFVKNDTSQTLRVYNLNDMSSYRTVPITGVQYILGVSVGFSWEDEEGAGYTTVDGYVNGAYNRHVIKSDDLSIFSGVFNPISTKKTDSYGTYILGIDASDYKIKKFYTNGAKELIGTPATYPIFVPKDREDVAFSANGTGYYFPGYCQSLVSGKHYAFWFKGVAIKFGKITIPTVSQNEDPKWRYCRIKAEGATVSWYIVNSSLVNGDLDIFADDSASLASYGFAEDNNCLDFILEGSVEEFTADVSDISPAVMKKMIQYKLPYGAPGTSENLPGNDKFTMLAKYPDKVISNVIGGTQVIPAGGAVTLNPGANAGQRLIFTALGSAASPCTIQYTALDGNTVTDTIKTVTDLTYTWTGAAWYCSSAPSPGRILEQKPDEPTPAELFGGQWEEHNYGGVFFRSKGGDSCGFHAAYKVASWASGSSVTLAENAVDGNGTAISANNYILVAVYGATSYYRKITAVSGRVLTLESAMPTGYANLTDVIIGQANKILEHAHDKGTFRIQGGYFRLRPNTTVFSDAQAATGMFKITRSNNEGSVSQTANSTGYMYNFDTNNNPAGWTGNTGKYGSGETRPNSLTVAYWKRCQ